MRSAAWSWCTRMIRATVASSSRPGWARAGCSRPSCPAVTSIPSRMCRVSEPTLPMGYQFCSPSPLTPPSVEPAGLAQGGICPARSGRALTVTFRSPATSAPGCSRRRYGDVRGPQRVGLGVERLADGGGAGVPDPHVPRRHDAGRRGPGQLGPGRARLAVRRDRDAEGLRQMGHEPEPGGVVLGRHPAPARPARRAGRGGTEDIGQSLASTRRKSSSLTRRSFHVAVLFVRPYATTHETRFALVSPWRATCFTGVLTYETGADSPRGWPRRITAGSGASFRSRRGAVRRAGGWLGWVRRRAGRAGTR